MIQPWQIEMLDKITKFKGRGVTQITGRNSGKSQMSSVAFQRLWDELHSRPVEDLKLSEGTVYGSRYYCVEPIGGSWREMEHWCHTTLGEIIGVSIWAEEKAPSPAQRWYMNNRKFWFRDEKDRTMFVLKWR
jgi:hypothetical protein